ncbi:MAG: hypothetical protein ACD_16C00203G0005 [uncultured bacterium]|nr:MAG: hypothetical protein ACD_16C00203G0005 [uncultured bacterium]OFW74498.1 MAG: hypothetical protein A2Z80_02060 [Alphaproteobacteria bacterium GWA2_41_27]OFW84689.1 MAG: hypothetical protein A3E50_05905 [Alphaproteobacteria bacterium RIFCSPHIGHO2_12_FULL_42_100]OFW86300.1 MAG: hypothetical protein A2W06_04810 [Alphaproteobacteria bacterium RBG_16_42_14]OFW91508.1 MAG: hypothetical protein A2W46_00135 [Alphaproteobacteria bacterium RIFCSPHIGHO2_12_42_13]OFW92801.1 MAG: hypothetical protei
MDKKHDYALETLIDLDGFIAEIWQGYWVKIEAKRVEKDKTKPHGIKYSLTLHNSKGERELGYDNAHSVPHRSSIKVHDHKHKSGKIIRYDYKDAGMLLEDFWKDVDRILERKK